MNLTDTEFLQDVASHKMTVVREDGLYRHISFGRPGSSTYRFDLLTWPGHLCYTGDMGTFVFQRLDDMLQFFRTDRREDGSLRINLKYWAEKCEAECSRGQGIREFDPEAFKREITEQRRSILVGYGREMTLDQRTELWDELELVRCAADEGEARTMTAVQDWSLTYLTPHRHEVEYTLYLNTSDFPSCKRYTHSFLWCCYALAWGIEAYDNAKAAQENESTAEEAA